LIAGLAIAYTAFLVYASGPKNMLLSCLLYAPAALLYARARRERGLRIFAPPELALFGVILLGAVVAVELLVTGTIRL
jgi:arginine:ornithine antiporter/lysine permease